MPECNPWSRCCSLQLCLRSKNESCWRLQSDEEMEMKKNGVQRRIDCGGGDKHTVLKRNWKLLWGTVWIMSVRQARLTTSAPQCVLRLMNFFDAHLLKWTRGRKLQFEILELWDQLLGSHLSRVQRKHRHFLPLILSGRVGAEKFDSDVLTDFLWLKTHHYCIYLRFAIQNDFFTILYIWHRLCVNTWRHSIHIKWHETTPFSRKWTIFHEAYRHLRKYADNISKEAIQ